MKIYRSHRRKKGITYSSFDVVDYSSGRRKLVSFAEEDSARQRAAEVAILLANGQGDVLTLTSSDRASYLQHTGF